METGERNSQQKEEAEKSLLQTDSIAKEKKRATLRFMFLGYLIVSAILVVIIANAIYINYRSENSLTQTSIHTLISSSTHTSTQLLMPSETSPPSPVETFTPQPVSTFTIAPYPEVLESPYPINIENSPYPLTTEIPTMPQQPTVALSNSTTELSEISKTEESTLIILPTETIIYISTKTPTRIKNPCPCSHDLYDCKDFSTHALAQACYDYCVLTGWGDAHHLDKSGTGIVCKGLP